VIVFGQTPLDRRRRTSDILRPAVPARMRRRGRSSQSRGPCTLTIWTILSFDLLLHVTLDQDAMPSTPKHLKGHRSSLRPAVHHFCILFLICFLPLAANGQQQNQTTKPSPGMGVSTGAAHPAVKDSKSRPITAGGFVDNAPPILDEVTAQAGLNNSTIVLELQKRKPLLRPRAPARHCSTTITTVGSISSF
jgi:hypothetical protein